MRDGKVNWTKFGQIAKASATVIECAKLAPEIESDPRVEALIMKVPILSEDVSFIFVVVWSWNQGRALLVNGEIDTYNSVDAIRDVLQVEAASVTACSASTTDTELQRTYAFNNLDAPGVSCTKWRGSKEGHPQVETVDQHGDALIFFDIWS